LVDLEEIYNKELQVPQPRQETLEPPSQRSLTPSSFFTGAAALLLKNQGTIIDEAEDIEAAHPNAIF
jgi:hypothetical protein